MNMAIQSRVPTILLTRPMPQSLRFAGMLKQALPAQSVLIAPLMAPQYLSPPLPKGPHSALILTSETAVTAARALKVDLPQRVWCVGDRTAEAARAAGFTAQSAAGDAAALIALVCTHGEVGPLLHLCGQHNIGDVATRLTDLGVETHSAVVYRQVVQALSTQARDLVMSEGPVILPVFSPRSARLFVAESFSLRVRPLWLAALSSAVSDELLVLPHYGLETAEQPNANAMVVAVMRLIASAS